jgi:hypothetical protein
MTKGEKRLLGATIGGVGLLILVASWRAGLDADPALNIPTPKMPSLNAYDFYVQAANAHKTLVATTPGAKAVDPVTDPRVSTGLTPQQLAQRYPLATKEAWIKKNAPVFQLLRRGFAYEYRTPPVRTSTAPFMHYADFRELTRLLVIETHVHEEYGDWAAASRSMMNAFRLGHDIPRGGPLIAALVGYAIDAIADKELQKIMPHLDAAASRATAVQIDKLEENRVPYTDTLREEMWTGQASLQEGMRKKGWRRTYSYTPLDGLQLSVLSKRRIIDDYTQNMKALITQMSRPYNQRGLPAVQPNDPVCKLIMPVLESARWNSVRDEAFSRLVQIQLALHAYKLEHGYLPSTLQDLVPGYIHRAPRDPFGGAALHYRLDGNRYLLYSIGPDCKDDGGKPTINTATHTANGRTLVDLDSKGDIVAGINH